MYTQRRGSFGFTLVELLVVIAIIGLIAALLFPVFAKARQKAWQTTCVSNLRQIGQAFNLYAQDYDQHLPDQWSGRTIDVNSDVTSDWELYLLPYTKNREINHCPSDTTSRPIKDPYSNTMLLNSYATPFNVQGKSLAEIPAAASTVLQAENWQCETCTVNWLISQLGKKNLTLDEEQLASGTVYEQPEFRHNETGNYLFVDTHVKTYKGPNPQFPGYKTDQYGAAQCSATDPLPQ